MGYRLVFTVKEPEQPTRKLVTQGRGPFAGLIARKLVKELDAEDVTIWGSTGEGLYTAKWFDGECFREAEIEVLS